MDVTRHQFQDLLGAYALDACDPEEAAAIDSYIFEHADAAAEAERLRDVAAWLGAVGALNPPGGLRARLLAVASERFEAVPPVEALRRETERFDALLDSIEPADLDVITYNGLTVRDLVTHVAIVDEAFVGEHAPGGAGTSWSYVGAEQVSEMTEAQLPETAEWTFAQVRERFTRARDALVSLDEKLPETARLGGYSLKSALVIRAFETWTHCADIASAVGRAEQPVDPPVLRAMAELAVQTLPVALAAKGYEYPGRTARVVMTGPGGGDWTIACTAGDPAGTIPDVVLRVPVVEFCQRFADRLAVDDVPFEIDGDADLGRALVDAAPAFAGL
jgi:uncharacterized protein (TIGR03083 family)